MTWYGYLGLAMLLVPCVVLVVSTLIGAASGQVPRVVAGIVLAGLSLTLWIWGAVWLMQIGGA